MQEDRVMIFIDGANLVKGWNQHCSERETIKKLSYEKLVSLLSKNNKLIRPYFYDAVPEQLPENRLRFLDKLRSFGITVVTKTVQKRSRTCRHCSTTDFVDVQKGVDVALVTDLLSLAFENAYDLAIIVSGDNDFSDAVNYIKSKGKKCWVVAFKNSLSKTLRRSCDRTIMLEELFDDLAI